MDRSLLKNLSPANFAFVMSSGALSIIFHRTDWFYFSWAFLIIGSIGYAALSALFIWRVFILRKEVLQDLKDVKKMFKYLTFSAGSSSLAVSYSLLGHSLVGLILGSIGVISSIILTYTLFCTLFFHVLVPIEVISPFWLLLAIASNSSGLVITTLWKNEMIVDPIFLLLAFCFWSFGVLIYVIFMTLNIFRMLFFPFEGHDMDPCYWTCMGAAAIAVVDGSQFVVVRDLPLFFATIKPFIEGMVLLLWEWGTAWIPILCLMELWKAWYFKVSFRYQPSLWAMVFPLGMYTAATDLLYSSTHLEIFHKLVPIFLWVTFAVWCLVAYMSRFNPFSWSRSNL